MNAQMMSCKPLNDNSWKGHLNHQEKKVMEPNTRS